MQFKSETFVFEGQEPTTLGKALRAQFPGASWNQVKKLIATGKVKVSGVLASEPQAELLPGTPVELQMGTPRLREAIGTTCGDILYSDPHVVVVNKRAGVSSVDHDHEPISLESEVRRALQLSEKRPVPPMFVVHRLDKVTSGVMLFARSKRAQTDLKAQFRAHTTGRRYLAVAHGAAQGGTLSYRLVRDRGDGMRGVTQDPNLGTRSVTHVQIRESLRRCTFIECRLETGRTHQIRIHLAETGNPLVGDPLYTRGHRGPLIESSETLLHAAQLSFEHPIFRKRHQYEADLPSYFAQFLVQERKTP